MEEALARSPELRQELRELVATIELLRGLPRPEAPPALAGLVMARVRAGEAEPATWRNLLGRWLEPRFAVPVGVAAVALAVIVDSPFEGVSSEAMSPAAAPRVVAEAPTPPQPRAERASVDVGNEMRRLRLARLARRGTRHPVVEILRGAGHPHSPALASHLDGDVALVGLDGR